MMVMRVPGAEVDVVAGVQGDGGVGGTSCR